MGIREWLDSFGDAVEPDALNSSEAASLVSFVIRYADEIANIVEVRTSESGDLIVLDFRTGRPQESAYPIKHTEPIAVYFTYRDTMPLVFMLRPDFPDTPHQQLAIEGYPRAICIDDRPWPEARLTWTPSELVHRTLSWFRRAARGELQDARQPIDPVLLGSPLSFLMPRAALQNASELDLVGIHEPNHHQTLRVTPLHEYCGSGKNSEPICVIAYRVPPERMTRMKFAPSNLGSLSDVLAERGIDLFADMSVRLERWLEEGKAAAWRLRSRLAVIVEMPIVSTDDEQQTGTDLRAYLTDKPSGDLAVALGVAFPAEQTDKGSQVGYVRSIENAGVDRAAISDIEVQVAEVHYEFDRALATQLSGRSTIDPRKAVLVGAGAIGSHVSNCLIREGRFSWTIIDDDYLLPHNLARHTVDRGQVTKNKAQIASESLSCILEGEAPARAIGHNLLSGPPYCSQIDSALNEADLIIDATASVLAERFVSDHSATARRISIFFNPTGTDAVLLAEPDDRSVTLRDLEAQYLGLASTDGRLATHLAEGERAFAYTGACRAVTNLIPESQIMTLSGLVSRGLGRVVDSANGAIHIWSLGDDGEVSSIFFAPEPVTHYRAADWKITLDAGLIEHIMLMRLAKLPNETGGILFGVVDIPAKRIHLVGAGTAPPDSKESANGFTRGTDGVQDHIDQVFHCTRGQVRYIGEWHSHPPRAGVLPSTTDLVQVDWLATLFNMDTLPALMLIAGDTSVSVILANNRAVPAEETAASEPESAPCPES